MDDNNKKIPVNLEISTNPKIVKIALKIKPNNNVVIKITGYIITVNGFEFSIKVLRSIPFRASG